MISHDLGVILVHVPFSGSKIFEESYLTNKNNDFISSYDVKKLPTKTVLEKKELGNTIRKFYDYDLFAIVKSPYQRAYEMWKNDIGKLKRSKIAKQTLGEYYENLLNGWNTSEDTVIETQVSYLKSTNNSYFGADDVDFSVDNLFYYEDLVKTNLVQINSFFEELGMPMLNFYSDYELKKDWRETIDDHAVEVINYIFDEDFDYCGYGKI